ncbi:MAG: hypothetical protein SGPRY_009684, partial [Prymnesium sp.]
ADSIVSRWHPQDNKLQFALCVNASSYRGYPTIPGSEVEKAGDMVGRSVHDEFVREAERAHADNSATAEAVKSMLDDLFTGPTNTALFQATHITSPASTRHAMRCATLLTKPRTRTIHRQHRKPSSTHSQHRGKATNFNLFWITLDDLEGYYPTTPNAEREYLFRACELVEQKLNAGLLQLVVRWGRHEMLKAVFNDSSLVEQRQVTQVQQAFNDALKLSTMPSYDTRVVDLLLDQGARSQEVFAAKLFELDGDPLYSDAFGYCAGMTATRELPEPIGRRHSTSSLRNSSSSPRVSLNSGPSSPRMPGIINKVRLINMIAGPARLSLSFREREGKVGAMRGEGDAGLEARLARAARREKESWRDTFREKRRSRWSSGGPNRPTTRALATRRMGISRLCGTSARVAASPMVSEGFKSPYREEHVRVLQRFVHGFEAYATARRTLDTFDIVLWAVLCGAFKLAKTLWLRKDCESPLRLSLLVQHMCHRIRLKEKRRINELLETEGFFRSNAIQLLDNLPDQETARKLLLSTSSPKAALGARDRSLCLLDLAIDLRNAVIEDIWKGRSPDCGKVQLVSMVHNRLIFMQIPAALCRIQLLPLKANDLFEWPPERSIEGQVDIQRD